MSIGKLFGWVLGAVLMVIVGVFIIRLIPPLSRFVFGTTTTTTNA
jgi:hypothetical protein